MVLQETLKDKQQKPNAHKTLKSSKDQTKQSKTQPLSLYFSGQQHRSIKFLESSINIFLSSINVLSISITKINVIPQFTISRDTLLSKSINNVHD
jgi:hypothetical protein